MTTSAPAPAKPLYWLFAAILLASLWFSTRAWHKVILDRHAFRQTQTAISAYWIKAAGPKLAYETPLFGPPWSIPLEFPVYEWIVAQVSAKLGTGLEPTGRGVSLFFFLATLPAVYGLGGLLSLAPSRRLLVLSVILASPTYLFWARTFMIETTALCFSTWFLLALARALRDGSVRWAAGAAVLGALAALAKVTTFLVFCPPAAALFFWLWRRDRAEPGPAPVSFSRRLMLWGAPFLVTALVSGAWLHFADAVKRANPFAATMVSSNLTRFNWGTLDQRWSAAFWRGIGENLTGLMFGGAALAVLLVGFVLAGPALRRGALWGAGFFAASFLLFSNLYFLHDYYYCANALFLLGGAGLLLVGLWENVRVPAWVRGLLLVVFFASQLGLYDRQFGAYLRSELPRPPEIASVIHEVVPPEGVVLIYGWDWNSLVPYYAERRAVMVPLGRDAELTTLESILVRLPPLRISALLLRQGVPSGYTAAFLRERLQRFDLDPTPIATSADGDLYLPKDEIAHARQRLDGRTFASVEVGPRPMSAVYDAVLQPVAAAVLDQPFFAPRPTRGRTQYGMGAGELDGHPVLNSHAPSELYFTAPASASRVEAVVGLPDAAYLSATPTDGVDVVIVERLPEGGQRVLFQRSLDPLHQPADRGPQTITFALKQPVRSTLVFGIYPGPANNVTCDWAYWQRITIR